MPSPAPAPSPTPTAPARRRALRTAGLVLAGVPAALVAAVLLAGAAAAQTATTVSPGDGIAADNPNSGQAGLVFFAVTGIIIIGGFILYLRNRKPRESAGA